METHNGTTINWTTDYDIFKLVEGNRNPDHSHVRRIKESILSNGWFSTSMLTVSPAMRVYDGQHRLWALREIKRETGRIYRVGYLIGKDLTLKKTQISNNFVSTWKPRDYIDSYITLKKEPYVLLKEIIDEYNLTYTSVLSLMKGVATHQADIIEFRGGELKVANPLLVKQQAAWINECRKYYPYANNSNFVHAILFFWRMPEFNPDEFLKKLKAHRNLMYPVTTTNEYKKLILDLYNYRRKGVRLVVTQF